MSFVLTQEQRLLKDQVRSLLEEQAAPETLRRLISDNAPWNPTLWRTMAELGLQGAAIPEAYGGVGLGVLDLCVISEELGRAVAPVPFASSICLAAEAIKLAASDEQKARWLPPLATGETVATFAWSEGNGAPLGGALLTRVKGSTIHGGKSPVPDAAIAGVCVVLAEADGAPVFAIVALDHRGVSRTPLKGFDELRHHARVDFNGASAEVLTAAQGREMVREFFDRAAVLQAFEQLGGTRSALYMARDYTLERFIFGRRLASYQAVKHNLANILVMEELARSNALYAVGAIESQGPDRRAAAANARIGATAAYEKAARENLQLHGGIGFTWEANCHFHYRRARLLALNLGSVDAWTDWLVDALGSADKAA